MHHHNPGRHRHAHDRRPGEPWTGHRDTRLLADEGAARPDRRFARDPLESGERLGTCTATAAAAGCSTTAICASSCCSMITAKPAHGYDLIKALEERMGGGYSPSPGVIYPTLTMLEEQGYRPSDSRGRQEALSGDAGRRGVPEGQPGLRSTPSRPVSMPLPGNATWCPTPRIIRAIENLKTALRLRLAGGPIPDERVAAIAAAIDAAAAEAERG